MKIFLICFQKKGLDISFKSSLRDDLNEMLSFFVEKIDKKCKCKMSSADN